MPKVEINDIRLTVTAITQTVVVSIPNKKGTMALHQKDVSSDFQKCIIDFGANQRWNIADPSGIGKEYEVACVEKKEFKKSLYTRKDVLQLLSDAVKDGVGDTISLDAWIKDKIL